MTNFIMKKLMDIQPCQKKTKVNNTVFLKIESVIISNLAESRKTGLSGSKKMILMEIQDRI